MHALDSTEFIVQILSKKVVQGWHSFVDQLSRMLETAYATCKDCMVLWNYG